MKKLILWLFLSTAFTLAYGQEVALDSVTIQPHDSLLVEKDPLIKFESGVFLETGFQMIPIKTNYGPTSQLFIGLQYKNLFGGFGVYNYQGDYQTTVIFPNNFNLAYKYGAARLGLRAYDSKYFEINAQIQYGKGDAVWIRESNDEKFIRSKFDIIEPQVMVLYTPIEQVKLFTTLGYKSMQNLDIVHLSNKDFSGITFGFGIRCGIYQQ
ncbi:hypothetical protein [Marinoscillum pacificum]|uniref:hypothetical protein n=1 Tax=Marinoscillum pacificum TaxID=392723 RepID=UPI002157115F|nr:hypothetical protein [Marinoscillum pacificum]